MTSDVSEHRQPRTWLMAALALLAVAAAYAETLGGGFVWDDRWLIEEAPLVQQLQSVGTYFQNPLWVGGEWGPDDRWLYRPLVTLSYALDQRLHAGNPAGFHLFNVVAHLVNVALVVALTRRQGVSGPMAALLAALWGLMPRLAESVAWISGRTDVLAASFSLLALLVFPRKKWGPWLAALWFFVALLCKEVAISVLLALAVRAVIHPRGRRAEALLRLGPLSAAAVAYFGLRAAMLDAPEHTPSIGSWTRVLTVFEAIGRYAAMLVDAWRPKTQIGLVRYPDGSFVVLGVLVSIGLVVAVVRQRKALRKRPELAAMLALAATAFGLVLHAIPIPVNVVAADRFMYLPLAALVIAAAPALGHALERSRARIAVALVVLLSLGATARERAIDWGDEVKLWTDAVRDRHPQNALPWIQLGNVHLRFALYREALTCYERGLSTGQGQTRGEAMIAESLVGNTLSLLGEHERAISSLESIVSARRDIPRFWLDLALARQHALDFAGARAAARQALALFPGYVRARELATQLDELERDARSLPPPNATERAERRVRARFLGRVGRPLEATREWLTVLGQPGATVDDADAALDFCARFAPIEDAERVLAARRSLGGEPERPVLDAFAWRRQNAEALRRATRGLGLEAR